MAQTQLALGPSRWGDWGVLEEYISCPLPQLYWSVPSAYALKEFCPLFPEILTFQGKPEVLIFIKPPYLKILVKKKKYTHTYDKTRQKYKNKTNKQNKQTKKQPLLGRRQHSVTLRSLFSLTQMGELRTRGGCDDSSLR